MSKRIVAKLDVKSLENAAKELREYANRLEKNVTQDLIENLAETGAEIAKDEALFMDAYDSGWLVSDIEPIYKSGITYVYSGAPHSAFVEFGTGLEAKQHGQHPNPPTGWVYDSNEHGEDGWWYFDKYRQKWRWTKGFVARPYMYITAKRLREELPEIAKKVFKESGLDD